MDLMNVLLVVAGGLAAALLWALALGLGKTSASADARAEQLWNDWMERQLREDRTND